MDDVGQSIAFANLDDLLTPGGPLETEMRRERTPEGLLDWIDRLNAEIASSDEDRKRLRLATGPIKLLFEEVRPLALFGRWLAKDHALLTVEPMASKEARCDGIIRSASWDSPQMVEVTMAIDGYGEHLRMLHLNEFGSAPAAGDIQFLREFGKTKVKETSLMAHESSTLRRRACNLIRDAADKKLAKDYPPNMWLLIAFDDHLGFMKGREPREETYAGFQEFVQNCILTNGGSFAAVFVVGSSGNLVAGGQVRRN